MSEKLANLPGFDDFIGQEKVKQRMQVYVESAKIREAPLYHTLFVGPSGLGKKTMAYIITNELGVNFRISSASYIERVGDMAAILTNLNERDILFIEDMHRINKYVEEILPRAMKDFQLDIVIGQGESARSILLDLPNFTLIGSTSKRKLLSHSLLEQFGIIEEFVPFSIEELQQIILIEDKVLDIQIEPEAAFKIAEFSNGTPKIALRLLKQIRDFAIVKNETVINEQLVASCIKVLGIDGVSLASNPEKNSRFIPENVRNKVWRRDKGKCVQCETNKNLEFDHIIPFSKGGSNTARNLQLLCEKCNREKYNKI